MNPVTLTTPVVMLTAGQLQKIVLDAIDQATAARNAVAHGADLLLDTNQLCERLGCSISKLNRLVRDEGVPYVLCGKVRRFRPTAVDAWLEGRTLTKVA